MPSVELSNNTKEEMKQEAEEAKPKSNLEIFENPQGSATPASQSSPVSLPSKEEELPKVELPKVLKPKRKLTEKQLEALKRGREKSIETRKKNKEAKKVNEAKKVLANGTTEPHVPHNQHIAPPPQPVIISAPQAPHSIDYDKIINGVVGRMETLQTKRANREHLVAENVNAFEEKIRYDERNTVLQQIDDMQKKEDQERQRNLAHKYLSKPKPVVDSNPYAYALQMGSNSRYRRY